MTASGRGKVPSSTGSPVNPDTSPETGSAVGDGSGAVLGCTEAVGAAVGAASGSVFPPQAESNIDVSIRPEIIRVE
ncbi:hypothetical protein D3C75_1144140 [compost metagenome]